jgi:hypothetical protein
MRDTEMKKDHDGHYGIDEGTSVLLCPSTDVQRRRAFTISANSIRSSVYLSRSLLLNRSPPGNARYVSSGEKSMAI